MLDKTGTSFIQTIALLSRALALLVCLCSGVVLFGYLLHIGAVVDLSPDLPGMSPLTALTLLMLAAAALADGNARWREAKTLALTAIAIAVVTLLVSVVFGGDRLSPLIAARVFMFNAERAGLMSPATAMCLVSLGIATLSRDRPRLRDPVGALALVVAGFALLGYAYGAHDLYAVPLFRTMALHTALAIAALALASLTIRPQTGWAAIVTSRRAGGAVARGLLAFTLLPPIAGWVLLRITDAHRLGPGTAMAFLVLMTVVPLWLLILRTGNAASQLEEVRRDRVELQRAKDRELRIIADSLPVLIAFIDKTLTYRFANKTYKDWLYLPPEQLVGRKVYDLFEDDEFAPRRAHMEAALAGREARFELPWPHRDGRAREAEIRYLPRTASNGEVDGFYAFVSDITDRKTLERALVAKAEALEVRVEAQTRDLSDVEARATVYFNLSPEYLLLIRIDEAQRVTFADINPAAEQVFRRRRADIMGAAVGDVVPPDSARDIEHYGRACAATREVQAYQVNRTYFAGQDIVIDTLVAPVGPSQPGGFLVLFSGRDVTEQRKIAEQLRQSQKMEAVGQLTGGLAHDFNNLMTGITGSLELLQVRVAQGRIGEVERYVAAAQGAARRAAALTHRLLAFSRRQTLDPKPTDANRLVAGMRELIQRTVGPEIVVETVTAAGLWNTLIDPGQLENALLNLCINARDAMPDGGRLTIETANRWLDERAARERDVPPGQYISVCVSDTGTGMPPDVIERAFEPFFTTKPLGMGTGLGLSMIYGFARQSGGQVRIYSERKAGTMVCLYLPRHLGAAEDAGPAAELSAAPRASQGETVLVVDDEPTVRMLVTEVLEDLGYTAIEAADGNAGLKVLQSDIRIDLLVTDVGLPGGMNGRQVADAARVGRPALKVLFITGYAENAVLSHGHLDPGMHVLTKPFAMEALATRIKDLITA